MSRVPRPQTKGLRTQPATRSEWILSPFWDLTLFIGAPLVCIAVFLPLRAYFSSRQIALFLLAFFTFGHHLPTFIRAYGDRELFERFKARFLLAPPLIFATAFWLRSERLFALLIFVSAWDIWHVLMQHYGFMRIYDAKRGVLHSTTARLDWAVSLSWYLTLIAVSPHYLHNVLKLAYSTGFPVLDAGTLTLMRGGAVAVSAALSVAYVGHHIQLWRAGKAVSWRKLVTLAIFLAATFYLYVLLNDFLVGFTVWSAFHCIQYYGIVWAYNRSRVDRGRPATAFLRFLFRPRSALVVLYLFLIFAYGGVNYIIGFVSQEWLMSWLLAFVATSNALHYYYDGFIWKVRDKETRKDLHIEPAGGAQPAGSASGWQALWNSGVSQAGYLALVLAALWALETSQPGGRSIEINRSLVAAAPRNGEAHFALGAALEEENRLREADASYRQAVELAPDSPEARNNLAGVLVKQGKLEEAAEQYRAALKLSRQRSERQENASHWLLIPPAMKERQESASPDVILCNLGDVRLTQGRREDALQLFGEALEANPDSARARTNRGSTLIETGNLQQGIAELKEAVRIDPDYSYAHFNLGVVWARQGKFDEARAAFEKAARSSDPAQRAKAEAALQQLLR